MPTRFVIHTVGPVWHGGNSGEPELLASCYSRCMSLAADHDLRSIAFPGISTGVFGYPVELAARTAVKTVRSVLINRTSIQEVIFCCFAERDFSIYQPLLKE